MALISTDFYLTIPYTLIVNLIAECDVVCYRYVNCIVQYSCNLCHMYVPLSDNQYDYDFFF